MYSFMKKQIFLILAMIAIVTILTLNVLADNLVTNVNYNSNKITDKEMKKCLLYKNRTEKTIIRTEKQLDLNIEKLIKAREKFDPIVQKYSDKGYDTSDLESNLSLLDDKIDQISDDSSIFIDSMDEVLDLMCVSSANDLNNALVNMDKKSKIVIQDALDIKDLTHKISRMFYKLKRVN